MSTQALKAAAGGQPVGQQNALVAIKSFLDARKGELGTALPKHLSVDRMVRLALTALQTNPALQRCTPRSVYASVLTASQLGLEIGVLGQAYLVPYKDEATLVPGWQGLLDLVARAGKAQAWTGAVYEGDFFEWELGAAPILRHRPAGEDDVDRLTHVYACGRIAGQEHPIIEVWTAAKVWKHRDRFNKVGTRHYSYQHPEMYARKVVLLQVLKHLPKSIQLTAAIDLSSHEDTGAGATLTGDYVVVAPGVDAPETSQEPAGDEQGVEAAHDSAPAAAPSFLERVAASGSLEELDLIRSEADDALSGNALKAVTEAIKGRVAALREQQS